LSGLLFVVVLGLNLLLLLECWLGLFDAFPGAVGSGGTDAHNAG
jgi:hypothetical protein